MSYCKHLTITPINKNLKSKSNIDFREQCERTSNNNLGWCWDDSKNNKSKAGYYFAFLFYGSKVVIHKIIKVKQPSERLPSWSLNVGQTDRNVLELSGPITELTWDEWLMIEGPQTHMGTYTTLDLSITRPKLYMFLQSFEPDIEFNMNIKEK